MVLRLKRVSQKFRKFHLKSLTRNSRNKQHISSDHNPAKLKLEKASKLPKSYRDYDRPNISYVETSPQDYRSYNDIEYFSESSHFEKFKFPEFQQVSTFVTYSGFLKECSVLKKDITSRHTVFKGPYNFRDSYSKGKSVDENQNVLPSSTLGDLLMKKVISIEHSILKENSCSNDEDVPNIDNSSWTEVLDTNFVDVSKIDETSLNEISNMISSNDMLIDENLRLSPISMEDNFSRDSTPTLVIDTDDEPTYDNIVEKEKDADTSLVEMDISSDLSSDHGDELHKGVVEYISIQDSFSYDDDSSSDESCVITGICKGNACEIEKGQEPTDNNGSTTSILLNDNNSYSSESCLDCLSLEDDIQSVISINSPICEDHLDTFNISSDSSVSTDSNIDESIFTEFTEIPDSERNIKAAEKTLSNWLSKTGKQVSQERVHEIALLFMKLAEKSE